MPLNLDPAAPGPSQGSATGPLAGTGTSVSGGVQSIFEYNGLYLNIRDWWDTFLVTKVDGLDDADIRDSRENNPDEDGETPFDSYYSGRTITLSGKIRAFTLAKRNDLEQGMRRAFGELNEVPLIVRNGNTATDFYILCKKYQKLVIPEEQNSLKHERDFQVTLRASKPFFLSLIEKYALMSPTLLPAAIDVSNAGNYISKPRLVINGPITNPTITNTKNGRQVIFNGSIASGDSITIDVLNSKVFDKNGANRFDAISVLSDTMAFDPGVNQIQLTGTGMAQGSTSLQVFWNDTWV